MAKRRKDPYYHRGEPGFWSKFLKIFSVILVIAIVLGFAWALTLLQPKRIGWDNADLNTPDESGKEYSALLDDSLALEKKFKDAARQHEPTADDLFNLREAIEKQREYLFRTHNHNLGEGNARIDEMTVILQTNEAKPMRDQSIQFELQAGDLENKKDLDGAKKLYEQAAALEDKILHDELKGNYYTTAARRSITLHRKVEDLTAEPLFDESHSAEITARAALDRQDWKSALDNFKRAYDLQGRLDREFSQLSYTNPGRYESLSREITALRSLPDHEKVAQQLADAHKADDAGDYPKAADLYQEAKRLQRNLNTTYPDSRFADPSQIESIETLLETANSRSLATEIRDQAASVFADLRHRNAAQAATTIALLEQKVEHFHDTYPQSTLIGDELQNRLRYLNFKRDDLGKIQDQVYALLLAVPGQTRFQLAKEEVPQSLYSAVTGGNPSRNLGPQLPVDSISWLQSEDFCQRLSWILSRPVRLPKLEEFNAALGPTDKLDTSATWNADNSNGVTQPVATKAANAAGFYDLLGNVAEWLDRPLGLDPDVAPIIGGNAQTPVDALHNVPSANLPMDSSNRFTGFRFVVDSDDSVPVMPAAPATTSVTTAKAN